MTLTILLGGVLVMAAFAQCMDINDIWNKVTWTGNLLGAAIGAVVATFNLWAGLLIVMVFVSQSIAVWVIEGPTTVTIPDAKGHPRTLDNVMLTSGPMPALVWKRTASGAAIFAGAYAVMAPQMQVSMVAPLLAVLAALGSLTGLWAFYSWRQGRSYHKEWFGGFWVMFGRVLPNKYMDAGQNMPNHAQSVAVLGIGALIGLSWLWSPWALVLVPVPLMAVAFCGGRHVTQGLLHLQVLGAAVVGLWEWRVGAGMLIGATMGLWAMAWWTTPPGATTMDSFRFWLWKESLIRWWRGRWLIRVMGLGTGRYTEFMAGAQHHACLGSQFTTAHNEYLQQTVEHGVIGLLLLLAYLGDALWRTWSGGVELQAVFLLGATLCSVALVNFPWTLTHELMVMSRPNGPPENVGSPSLIAISLVVALLAEAR